MNAGALALETDKATFEEAERLRRLMALLASPQREALDLAAQKAVLCRRGCSCLSGSLDCLKPIRGCIAETVHFIDADSCEICNYKIRFGSGCFCNCPVRIEIYKRCGV
jgi:hypothetical protein